MALVPMNEMIKDGFANHYAVGGFDVTCLSTLKGVLEAAELTRSPVVLMFAEVHGQYADLEDIAHAATEMAAKASVPTALHLDHGVTFDFILRAIRCGFTSIMFDGSVLPFHENVSLTKKVVDVCKPLGITVEAELGHVGDAQIDGDSLMTNPEEAAEFVEKTQVDALAVSIGNAHGKYKGTPKLDMNTLSSIKEACEIPLVLHGGSGIPDEDFKESIRRGIAKINIWTEIAQASIKSIREYMPEEKAQFPQINNLVKDAAREVAAYRMNVFGSSGKA